MMCETARYVSKCDSCRKVKANYMKPRRMLQLLSILDWKWEGIYMDFIVGLPLAAHFIPAHTNYNTEKYAEIYISRILCLHGVLKMTVFD
jgi:hypothetical protein